MRPNGHARAAPKTARKALELVFLPEKNRSGQDAVLKHENHAILKPEENRGAMKAVRHYKITHESPYMGRKDVDEATANNHALHPIDTKYTPTRK